MFFKGEITFDRFIRWAGAAALLIAGFVLVKFLSSALLPFLIALIIAYILNPLVEWCMDKLKMKSRKMAVLVVLTVLGIASTAAAWIVIPMIYGEGERMANLVQVYVESNHLDDLIPESVNDEIKEFMASEDFNGLITFENGGEIAQKILPGVFDIFSGSVQILIGLFGLLVIALYLIFIMLDYDKIAGGWKKLIPERYRGNVGGLMHDMQESMNTYFRAQAVKASIIGVLFAIGFSIVGIPMGFLLGLCFGALNMIPYLQIVGVGPAIFLALLKSLETGGSVWTPILGVLAVLVIVQLIDDLFLTPKILGGVTGLNPAIIMLSLSIWGALLGFVGLLIALPITTLLLSYYQRFLRNEEIIHDKH